MQSIKYIPGSNQALNASVATVQTLRSPGAVTNIVNTVSGFPTFFYATMGTPHTFTDPVTGETITIISDATAVDFAGTINAGKIDIVAIAPGYTDLGSKVGDIIIVRPVTAWADNIFNLMGAAHNDDGTLKTTSLDAFYKPSEISGNFVYSGGIIAISSGLTGTLSDIVGYISGLRFAKTAIANKVYTPSKDTYVDIDAAGTVYYTEVANGATSGFPLTAGRIRLGKVVTSGVAITSIVQAGYDALNVLNYPSGSNSPANRTGGYRIGSIAPATFGSTGNKSVTGVGFKPKMVMFYMLGIDLSGMSDSAIGAMDDTGEQFAVGNDAWGGGGANQHAMSKVDHCIIRQKWQLSTTPIMSAKYVSMDADGFTINVDLANNEVGYAWVAFG